MFVMFNISIITIIINMIIIKGHTLPFPPRLVLQAFVIQALRHSGTSGRKRHANSIESSTPTATETAPPLKPCPRRSCRGLWAGRETGWPYAYAYSLCRCLCVCLSGSMHMPMPMPHAHARAHAYAYAYAYANANVHACVFVFRYSFEYVYSCALVTAAHAARAWCVSACVWSVYHEHVQVSLSVKTCNAMGLMILCRCRCRYNADVRMSEMWDSIEVINISIHGINNQWSGHRVGKTIKPKWPTIRIASHSVWVICRLYHICINICTSSARERERVCEYLSQIYTLDHSRMAKHPCQKMTHAVRTYSSDSYNVPMSKFWKLGRLNRPPSLLHQMLFQHQMAHVKTRRSWVAPWLSANITIRIEAVANKCGMKSSFLKAWIGPEGSVDKGMCLHALQVCRYAYIPSIFEEPPHFRRSRTMHAMHACTPARPPTRTPASSTARPPTCMHTQGNPHLGLINPLR